jgi:hypothetical protein
MNKLKYWKDIFKSYFITQDMNKYIDFDKNMKIIYYNLYLENFNYVIKIPIFKKTKKNLAIKTEEFNLRKYTILFNCETRDFFINQDHRCY